MSTSRSRTLASSRRRPASRERAPRFLRRQRLEADTRGRVGLPTRASSRAVTSSAGRVVVETVITGQRDGVHKQAPRRRVEPVGVLEEDDGRALPISVGCQQLEQQRPRRDLALASKSAPVSSVSGMSTASTGESNGAQRAHALGGGGPRCQRSSHGSSPGDRRRRQPRHGTARPFKGIGESDPDLSRRPLERLLDRTEQARLPDPRVAFDTTRRPCGSSERRGNGARSARSLRRDRRWPCPGPTSARTRSDGANAVGVRRALEPQGDRRLEVPSRSHRIPRRAVAEHRRAAGIAARVARRAATHDVAQHGVLAADVIAEGAAVRLSRPTPMPWSTPSPVSS